LLLLQAAATRPTTINATTNRFTVPLICPPVVMLQPLRPQGSRTP
jgi:hypothetical protein